MAKKLKEINPETITIIGGPNCESPMGKEIIKNVKHIDFVFSGPGLKSFSEFVQHLINNDLEKCDHINGVFSRKNCTLSNLGTIGEHMDINEPLELYYDDFLDSFEKNFPDHEITPTLFFETSRGCWWGEHTKCTFCGLNPCNLKYQFKSPKIAIKQFETLFNKYSSRCTRFAGVDNILPKTYIKEVLPFIDTPQNVTIFYETKAILAKEDMAVLSNARVIDIQEGIESLSTSTLKLMKKGTNTFQNLIFLKNCLVYNIKPVWNLLIGFPGESKETYKKYIKNLPLIVHLPPPVGVYPVRFDRYSHYFENAEKYGLELYPFDYYEFAYPFNNESVSNLAFHFYDNNSWTDYSVTMSKWIFGLREKHNLWISLWFDRYPSQRPGLYFKNRGDTTVVHDSLSGKVIEYEISDVARNILECLEHPGTLNTFSSHIPGYESEIGDLIDKGLIFQEGERYLSLILSERPSLMDIKL